METPNPWDVAFARMDRIETKLDRLAERVVPRDEFERHKTLQSRMHDDARVQMKEMSKAMDDARVRQDETAAKWRLFWAGLLLTPIMSGVIAWIAAGGIRP